VSTIEERYQDVLQKFEAVCNKTGKKAGEVELIAVSKNFPADYAQKIYDLGQRNFGENRAQEMAEKYAVLPQDIRWHFIGRLQRNKVKYIIDKACMIHSVDSVALAEEISRQAVLKDVHMPILIQVNLDEEETKAGFEENELKQALQTISSLPNLQVRGLMTIGAYHEEPEDSRPLFKRMSALFGQVDQWQIPGVVMQSLSMGMSHDFTVAIEEGASFVRVGSSIFGKRIYEKRDS
jgi:pyridoxal phosphate enzyme (YggS family)